MTLYNLAIITFVIIFIISVITYKLLLKQSKLKKLKKSNDKGERWASQTKPIFGGMLFYVAFVISSIVVILFYNIKITELIGIFTSISLAFFMGFYDDTRTTHPLSKFIVQIIISIILIYSDIYIKVSHNPIVNYSLTVFWVVSLMNSLNMLDNMDAITGSVSSTIIISMMATLIFSGQSHPYFIILIGVLAAVIAFLFWNWNPSKLYMGDNGSQFIGTFLAIFGIFFFWNNNLNASDPFNLKELIVVALAFVIPIVDTTTVTINRLMSGKSPFIGDRNHTTHNLSYLGLSEPAIAIVFIIISFIGNGIAIYLLIEPSVFDAKKIMLSSGIFLIILSGLYLTTKIKKKEVSYENT